MPIAKISSKANYLKITILLIAVTGLVAFKTLSANVRAACAALPTDTGSTSQTFSTVLSGSYYPWVNMKAADSNNNSVWLQIDNNCAVNVGDANVPSNAWKWVNWQDGSANKMTVNLGVGKHTVKLIGKELGVKVSEINITADASCVPEGNGANCAASAAPVVVTPLPVSAPESSGTTTQTPITITPPPTTGTTTGPAAGTTQKPPSTTIIIPKNTPDPDIPNITDGDVEIEVGTPGTVDEVDAYLDGQNIAKSNGRNLVINTNKLPNGKTELTLKAKTKDGKTAKYKHTLYIKNKKSFWSRTHYTISKPYHFILRHLSNN